MKIVNMKNMVGGSQLMTWPLVFSMGAESEQVLAECLWQPVMALMMVEDVESQSEDDGCLECPVKGGNGDM